MRLPILAAVGLLASSFAADAQDKANTLPSQTAPKPPTIAVPP